MPSGAQSFSKSTHIGVRNTRMACTSSIHRQNMVYSTLRECFKWADLRVCDQKWEALLLSFTVLYHKEGLDALPGICSPVSAQTFPV